MRWLYTHKVLLLPKRVQLLIFLMYNSKTKIDKGTYFACNGISTILIPCTLIGESALPRKTRAGPSILMFYAWSVSFREWWLQT